MECGPRLCVCVLRSFQFQVFLFFSVVIFVLIQVVYVCSDLKRAFTYCLFFWVPDEAVRERW